MQDELCPYRDVFQVNEQVPGLLHYPRLDRMLGGSEDPDAAGAVLNGGNDLGLRPVEQPGGPMSLASRSSSFISSSSGSASGGCLTTPRQGVQGLEYMTGVQWLNDMFNGIAGFL